MYLNCKKLQFLKGGGKEKGKNELRKKDHNRQKAWAS